MIQLVSKKSPTKSRAISCLSILKFKRIHSFFRRYEAKRLEIEAWLARMENRAERMGGVATTADVLEAQQKEQKVSFEPFRFSSNFKTFQYSPFDLVFPCWTSSVQTSNWAVQSIDTKADKSLSNRWYISYQENDRICQSQVNLCIYIFYLWTKQWRHLFLMDNSGRLIFSMNAMPNRIYWPIEFFKFGCCFYINFKLFWFLNLAYATMLLLTNLGGRV